MDTLHHENKIKPFSTIQIIWNDIDLEGGEKFFDDIVTTFPCLDCSVMRYPYPSFIYCTSPLWTSMILDKVVPEELLVISVFKDIESRKRSCKHLTVTCSEISFEDLDIITKSHGGEIILKREDQVTLEFQEFKHAAKAFADFELLRVNVDFAQCKDFIIKNKD